ncbi:MAG: hypothetical protein ACREQ5_16115, partial [Candidatus Dormibacteria bacterium]
MICREDKVQALITEGGYTREEAFGLLLEMGDCEVVEETAMSKLDGKEYTFRTLERRQGERRGGFNSYAAFRKDEYRGLY